MIPYRMNIFCLSEIKRKFDENFKGTCHAIRKSTPRKRFYILNGIYAGNKIMTLLQFKCKYNLQKFNFEPVHFIA